MLDNNSLHNSVMSKILVPFLIPLPSPVPNEHFPTAFLRCSISVCQTYEESIFHFAVYFRDSLPGCYGCSNTLAHEGKLVKMSWG